MNWDEVGTAWNGVGTSGMGWVQIRDWVGTKSDFLRGFLYHSTSVETYCACTHPIPCIPLEEQRECSLRHSEPLAKFVVTHTVQWIVTIPNLSHSWRHHLAHNFLVTLVNTQIHPKRIHLFTTEATRRLKAARISSLILARPRIKVDPSSAGMILRLSREH